MKYIVLTLCLLLAAQFPAAFAADAAKKPTAPKASAKSGFSGKVAETMNAASYTYVLAGQGGPLCGGAGPQLNLAAKTSFDGTVADVNMSPGQGFPTFALNTGEGKVTIVASPYRMLADAGFVISPGDRCRCSLSPRPVMKGHMLRPSSRT